jgi:hypothetical protein
MKTCKGLFHIFGSINFIDIFDILGAHFMYNVGTVGLITVMSLILKKGNLTCLTKLIYRKYTYLRLLFRFQLSRPRVERG